MTLFRSRYRSGDSVKVEEMRPPVELDGSVGAIIEQRARLREAADLVDATLARHTGEGSSELINLCLDLRSVLLPSPPGSQLPVRAPAAALPRRLP